MFNFHAVLSALCAFCFGSSPLFFLDDGASSMQQRLGRYMSVSVPDGVIRKETTRF
jgi:hypothetical protein